MNTLRSPISFTLCQTQICYMVLHAEPVHNLMLPLLLVSFSYLVTSLVGVVNLGSCI